MIANVRSGQLSNRLVSTAYALASAIEYRRNIWLTEFDDLKDNYECKVTWPQRVKIKYSRFWAFERWLAEMVKARFRSFHVPRVVSFWDYVNVTGAERQADKLRMFFAPKSSVIGEAAKFWQDIHVQGDVMVAVHVRRGDYAKWQGGKFFFDDGVYSRKMAEIEKAFADKGKKVRFVIFSHEPVNLANYSISSPVFKSDFNAIQDQWLMSRCDYIMGPPSTFSLWAAFIGKKLLAFIEDPCKVLEVQDFSYHGLKVQY